MSDPGSDAPGGYPVVPPAPPAPPVGIPDATAPAPYEMPAAAPYYAPAAPPYGGPPYGAPPFVTPGTPDHIAPSYPAVPHGTPPYGTPPAPGDAGYPAAPYGVAPVAPQRSNIAVWLIVIVTIIVLSGIVFTAVRVMSAFNQLDDFRDAAAPPAVPTEVTPSEAPPTWPGFDDENSAQVGDRLQAKIDEYKLARDSGSLWQKIPDSDFNRTAVSAFLYIVTDMRSATRFGVDAETAAEYEQAVAEYERKLLAQEPLGPDITITLSDRTFRYDGETGEGGYTDN